VVQGVGVQYGTVFFVGDLFRDAIQLFLYEHTEGRKPCGVGVEHVHVRVCMPYGGDVVTDGGCLLQNVVKMAWRECRYGVRESLHQEMVGMKTYAECAADQKNGDRRRSERFELGKAIWVSFR
jgi:hypothetical protein